MNNFNFLPEKFKDNIKNIVNVRLLYAGSVVFFIWMLIFGITIFANTQVLSIQNNALKQNIENISGLRETAEARDLEKEINEFNQLLLKIQDIKNSDKHDIAQIISDIAYAVSGGVELNSLTFNSSAGSVFISGHAEQRTQVIAVQSSLEESSLFKEVEGPLSNLLKSEDIDFQFTLKLESTEK
ncbi:MAG: hypothetical protein WDZ40_02825 [Candidatus Spechtbacterales bacterium]